MKYEDSANLTIAYDGNSLEDGTMDVEELAPALLAIGELINECNKVLNGKEEKIQVRIKSEFKRGSFQTDFVIVKDMISQIKLALGPAYSVKEILEVIGFYGGGLFLLIKAIKGRKIKKAKQNKKGQIEIIFEDESETVTTNINIYNVYNNIPIQESVEKIMKPLKREGIDSFYTSNNNIKLTEINKEEAKYFVPPVVETIENEELLLDSESIGVYHIVTAQFEEGYKWRLSNGQDKISASLTDKDFMKKIEAGEVSISREDLFKIKMKTYQWKKSDNSLRTENEITEIIEHIKAEKTDQLSIPLESDDEA